MILHISRLNAEKASTRGIWVISRTELKSDSLILSVIQTNEIALKQRAIALLESVGLGEHVDYYPHNLSGGQKQRVAIARALVSHPKMVLADEPTAALDSKSGRNIVKLMQELAREQGCTILIVTHDNRILDVADRIVELEDGRITA